MNTVKYEALAYQNNQLGKVVSEHWNEWLTIVEGAPWLISFKNSPKLKRLPQKSKKERPKYDCREVAEVLYVTAVWGFGVERKHETDVFWKKELARLQGMTVPARSSLNLIDRLEPLPVPFKDLDNWLEHLN